MSTIPTTPSAARCLCGEPGLTVMAYDAGNDVRIERAMQSNGTVLWKVIAGISVLSKLGEWEIEPMPSSRNQEFLDRCRFSSPLEAFAQLCATRSAEQHHPGGRT